MHPYSDLPRHSFWRRFVSDTGWRELDLVGTPKFSIAPTERMATAGSCFAQHITRTMKRAGLSPFVAETPHPLMRMFAAQELDSYEQFSARYGNIYTSRQGLELLRQALGTMPVVHDFAEHDGRWFDLLRPGIPKEGFATRHEAEADRAFHLQCVRRMFETVDVFVFTVGLTECWRHAVQGHTYPVCPGTVRGRFDPALHRFHNLDCAEVIDDLESLIREAHAVNPGLKFVFTVSPVPLVATRSEDNVLVASSYSKAVLRAAVGAVAARHPAVQYFPSFEIISHAASFGQYLASDLREVTERGVSHVMGCFMKAFYGLDAGSLAGVAASPAPAAVPAPATAGSQDPPVECEEVFNDCER